MDYGQAEKLAKGKGQSLPDGIQVKIKDRATEIYGKK
jgi:hypothetical protein